MGDEFSEVGAGYAAWAETYDQPGNTTKALEEPVVSELTDHLPIGTVLDAGCGTGRHAARLLAAGHEVIGVDSSPEMLAVARAKLPGADLREGALEALPLDDASVTGCVCALALSHLPRLAPAVRELGRVLTPGGRLIVSNPHPFATAVLGRRATYVDRDGMRWTIPEYAHMPSDYVEAFTAAGLTIRRCVEPRLESGLPAVIVWEAEA